MGLAWQNTHLIKCLLLRGNGNVQSREFDHSFLLEHVPLCRLLRVDKHIAPPGSILISRQMGTSSELTRIGLVLREGSKKGVPIVVQLAQDMLDHLHRQLLVGQQVFLFELLFEHSVRNITVFFGVFLTDAVMHCRYFWRTMLPGRVPASAG